LKSKRAKTVAKPRLGFIATFEEEIAALLRGSLEVANDMAGQNGLASTWLATEPKDSRTVGGEVLPPSELWAGHKPVAGPGHPGILKGDEVIFGGIGDHQILFQSLELVPLLLFRRLQPETFDVPNRSNERIAEYPIVRIRG
jgi:hypothetical protein